MSKMGLGNGKGSRGEGNRGEWREGKPVGREIRGGKEREKRIVYTMIHYIPPNVPKPTKWMHRCRNPLRSGNAMHCIMLDGMERGG